MRTRSLVILGCLILSAAAACAARQQRTYKAGKDVTTPQVVREVKANYTAAALTERIQGHVVMEAVVKQDGTVGDVTVTKSLDSRLDGQAVKAVKQWTFTPGTKQGRPVPVALDVEMTFTLK